LSAGKVITGEINIKLRAGELLPADTEVISSLDGIEKAIVLSELVDIESFEGEFFIESASISGIGEGYGLFGEKETFPEISFELRIINEADNEVEIIIPPLDSGGDSSGEEVEEEEIEEDTTITPPEDSEEETEEEIEEEIEGGGDEEEDSEETKGESSEGDSNEELDGGGGSSEDSEETKGESSEGDSNEELDGGGGSSEDSEGEESSAESGDNSGEGSGDSEGEDSGEGEEPALSPILGIVSFEEDFVYLLEDNQSVEIVEGSVKVDGEEINENVLDLSIENGEVIISTEYSTIEEGFGEEFLSNEIYEFGFSIQEFNLTAQEDTSLNILFVYEGIVLFGDKKGILGGAKKEIVENVTEEVINETIEIVNETILDETNVSNISKPTYGAILGQPVMWTERIPVSGPGSLIVEIPLSAEKIKVDKIDKSGKKRRVRDDEAGDFDATDEEEITAEEDNNNKSAKEIIENVTEIGENEEVLLGPVVDGEGVEIVIADSVPVDAKPEEKQGVPINVTINDTFVEVIYETPGPYSIEENIERGKRVKIIGPEDVAYENVLAFTDLPREIFGTVTSERVRVFWVEESKVIPIINIEDSIDGKRIYWGVPHLSNQTFEIIVVVEAEHLDENRTFISDIFEEVRELDGNWSEEIFDGEYVRVVFEIPLDNTRDITLHPRTVNGTPRIEIYEFNKTELIAEFDSLIDNEYNKVYLTKLQGTQDTFDLLILDGSVEFDHIIDPVGNTLSSDGSCGDNCDKCDIANEPPGDNTADTCADGPTCDEFLDICRFMWTQDIFIDDLNRSDKFLTLDTINVTCTIKCLDSRTFYDIWYRNDSSEIWSQIGRFLHKQIKYSMKYLLVLLN